MHEVVRYFTTADAVEKYLPTSCPATDKGHMIRQQKGITSTKQKIETALDMIETQRCMNPPKEREKWNQIFMTMGMINK